nr:hypothetical protein [Nocardia carnea]
MPDSTAPSPVWPGQDRERRRADRPTGTAARQLDSVHAHGIYDLEVDTGAASIENCSAEIKAFLARPPPKRAFDRLRATTDR